MLEMISGGKRRQPPFARRQFPARRLHLVDIENLVGASLPGLGQVREVQDLYTGCLGIGAPDQVVIASSHLTRLNAGLGWPHARYLARSGPTAPTWNCWTWCGTKTSRDGSAMWRSARAMASSHRPQKISPMRASG